MAKHRVLVTDKLAEEGLALLRAQEDIEVIVDTKLAKDSAALRDALQQADGIAVRSGTQLTAAVIENQKRLRAIVRAGVGVDNIDVPAATRQGIVVMNTPGGNTVTTAEHTIGMIFACPAIAATPVPLLPVAAAVPETEVPCPWTSEVLELLS